MDFNYTKIKLGNLLYKYCFPLYNLSYSKFKLKNDKTEIELLKKIITPGDYILDIGANIGFYAKLLSKFTTDKGKVFCFEPDSLNFKYLKKTTEGIENIMLFNNAVSDKTDLIKVYRSKLLNVDHRTYPVNNYDSVEEITSVSIDELIKDQTIPKVNIIKIDIQGYELTAFNGMKQLLSSSDDLKIIAEYWPHGFKRAGTSAIAFYDFFNELGYFFYLIDNNTLTKITKGYIVENNDKPFEFSFNVLIQKD
ncbi:MAG: FkbM family methyltransferase [Burkholderiales bacterium]|nr:FkbM family methyltransferase [Bacteroidia bacterium]